ncbi:GDSL-type esterase/lipase family protein, partial [Aliifodinibius sp. S!AR15-10]
GHFETELHTRYPDSSLFIRNMSDPGNTPVFRPHAARDTPWAFPGAERFLDDLPFIADSGQAFQAPSIGHFPYPDQWLTNLEADIIIAFFGYNESFEGEEGLPAYKDQLSAFIEHTLNQEYNGETAPELVLVSPIAFEDLSGRQDLPDGTQENENLSLYAEAMEEVAAEHDLHFVDAFTPTKQWFESSDQPLTIDGSQLSGQGYKRFGRLLADQIFGEDPPKAEAHRELIHEMVAEKNWTWHNDYKIPNGVHAYGRRYKPFGPDNYPYEIEKIRQMTAIRDSAIWRAAQGESTDLAAADAHTLELPEVETNYEEEPDGPGDTRYLYGQQALDTFEMAPGYQIELFASEEQFADLANPVQLSFDNQGRLWVAVMPSYPHWRPGDGKPNDKLLILEDTDGDGRADQQTTFADSLHLPVGFELTANGVLVSQGPDLKQYFDTDGDSRADSVEIVLSGFDDHDTHHAHSAYTADPSGAVYMG